MINFIKNNSPITICDIGASSIDKTEFIDELFNNTNSKLIGFEPNEEEFNKLEKNNPRKTFYDYAIGDGSEKYLNICKGPGMTSFLEPDTDYLNNFYWFDDFAQIPETKEEKYSPETASAAEPQTMVPAIEEPPEPPPIVKRNESVQAYIDFIESSVQKLGELIKKGFNLGRDYLRKQLG